VISKDLGFGQNILLCYSLLTETPSEEFLEIKLIGKLMEALKFHG